LFAVLDRGGCGPQQERGNDAGYRRRGGL